MKFREYTYLYVATDGRYSKIGVSDNIETRKPRAIRFHDGRANTAIPKIVKHWCRPDAAHLEKLIVTAFTYLAVAGQEWFDLPVDDLIEVVEKQIWYVDIGSADPKQRRPSTFNSKYVRAVRTEGLVRYQSIHWNVLTIMVAGRDIGISFETREDGGLRVWSDDLPGLVLSGSDPAKVLADITPAAERILESMDAE